MCISQRLKIRNAEKERCHKKTDRKRGVSFQEKYNKEEEGEERRRGKGGRDNKGGIERLEHYSGVNPLNLISV